jgi:hypothetical protein
MPVVPDTLTHERLPGIAFFMVSAHDHPLASYSGKIPKEVLGKGTQIVSPTSRNCPRGANSASCRLRPGGLLTFRPASFSAQRPRLGRNAVACGAQGLGRRTPFPAPHRRRSARWLDSTDVGGRPNRLKADLMRNLTNLASANLAMGGRERSAARHPGFPGWPLERAWRVSAFDV